MSKISRSVLINELDALAEKNLPNIVETLNDVWVTKFNEYGGLSINCFPNAVKAGEFSISNYGNNNLLPSLSLSFEDNIKRGNTSSYQIVVDGKIAKIGALKEGVKGNSFAQYKSGITGNPSKRNIGGYSFILSMLLSGKKVEVYHVTMDSTFDAKVSTIVGDVKTKLHCSAYDIESLNVSYYKEKNNGQSPFLNLKERNATYPMQVDILFNLVNERSVSKKKYVI